MLHESELAHTDPDPQCFHRPMRYDIGRPMIARGLLPASPSSLRDRQDRAITRARPRAVSRHVGRPRRRHHDGGAPRPGGVVNADRLVGGIRRHLSEGAVDRLDQRDASRCVVDARLRAGPGDDHTRSVDTDMQLLSASPPPSSMFRRGPFRRAHDREARAVDNEMQAGTRGGETQHSDDRRQAAFRLPQGQGEDEPERQRGFDGEIGIRPLPATGADAHGLPRGDRIRGQPHGDLASLNQRSVVCRPMPDGVCCRVLWVHARRHVEIIPLRSPRWPGGRSWRTEGAGSVHQRPAFEPAGPFPARAGMNRKLALDDPEFFDFIWDTVMDR